MSGGSLALAGGLKKHLEWGLVDNSTYMIGFNFMRNVGAGWVNIAWICGEGDWATSCQSGDMSPGLSICIRPWCLQLVGFLNHLAPQLGAEDATVQCTLVLKMRCHVSLLRKTFCWHTCQKVAEADCMSVPPESASFSIDNLTFNFNKFYHVCNMWFWFSVPYNGLVRKNAWESQVET